MTFAKSYPSPSPLPRPWGEGRVRGTHVTILMLKVIILIFLTQIVQRIDWLELELFNDYK